MPYCDGCYAVVSYEGQICKECKNNSVVANTNTGLSLLSLLGGHGYGRGYGYPSERVTIGRRTDNGEAQNKINKLKAENARLLEEKWARKEKEMNERLDKHEEFMKELASSMTKAITEMNKIKAIGPPKDDNVTKLISQMSEMMKRQEDRADRQEKMMNMLLIKLTGESTGLDSGKSKKRTSWSGV